MALLLRSLNPAISQYKDRRFGGNQQEFEECLHSSTTVYVGNLSFFTTEDQIFEVFSKVGDVKRIVMGLDKHKSTPCGFCFVVYYTREDTEDCVKYINGTMLDDRPIRVDFDWGFVEGRQFGRGRSGGQVRDEYRMDFDTGRGGYGSILQKEMEVRQQLMSTMADEMSYGAMGGYMGADDGGEMEGGPQRQDEDMDAGGGGGGGDNPTRFRGDSDDER
ncbi:hypothetical protein D9Q98_001861 [Chlorella vulgaris]|uniref:Nuclear cap-binding protein subunit 2 n=1 Tax=Chlorella vulgaris TaxID=3077 RepID=A0A9D4TVC3_CHLVU|nr:hypothetical protein D9Q98_001861 [Chlorella vulgaris]